MSEHEKKGGENRPRRAFSGARGENRPFDKNSRPRGERKPFGRPANGDKKPFGRPADGERKPFGRPANGERKPFARPADGERKPFGRPADGERKPFGRPADGERKPFGRPADGERKPFGRPATGERKPFARPADGERKSFARPANGDRKPFARPVDAPPQDPLSGGARAAAWDVLNRILLEDGFTSVSLSEGMDKVRLSPRDKRLCANIVYTTVEKLIYIDYALAACLKDAEGVDAAIRTLLRLSACQLLFMDRVPESAVVNEAVKLARVRGYEGLTGLVNGVLRGLLRVASDIEWPEKEDDLKRYLSIIYSMPVPLVEKIVAVYGEEEAENIIKGGRSHRFVTIRPNFMRYTDEQFEKLLAKKEGWRVEKGMIPHAWYVSGTGDISADEDFQAGLYSVQGEGSMLAAEAVGVKTGMNVLDCCAAPGGKTAYMAEKMENTGRVQAWDKHEHRVELIQKNAERLRLYNVRPMMRDALQHRENMEMTMDAVLLDAPCSGTGVLCDKPDGKYRVNDEAVEAMVKIQADMMDACAKYVKPGCVFVYSTCSILPEENAGQVEKFLARHPEFRMDALPDAIPEEIRKTAGPFGLQLLPGDRRAEGFFIARMVRE